MRAVFCFSLQPSMRLCRTSVEHTIVPGRVALPNPPAGEGMGKAGFPIPLRESVALPNSPAGEGMGKAGFPIPLRESVALPNSPAGKQ